MDNDNISDLILNSFLEEGAELLIQFEEIVLSLEHPVEPAKKNKLYQITHTLKGTAKVAGKDKFANFVHSLETMFQEFDLSNSAQTEAFRQRLLGCHSFMKKWLDGQEIKPVQIEAVLNGNVQIKELSENNQLKDDTLKSSTEPPKKVQETEKVPQPKKEIASGNSESVSIKRQEASKKDKKSTKSSRPEVLKVKRDQIDNIIKAVGELSTQLSVVEHHIDRFNLNSEVAVDALDFCLKYVKELQDLSLSLSLQPLDKFFQRMQRVCWDTAHVSKKRVQFLKKGADIELDKTVLDKILEPLIHLVRNAVDHGIESAEEREKIGKSKEGTLSISARQDAAKVILVIKDDGRGIDVERVRQKAINIGLISADQELSDKETMRLILEPGFSTREKVTEISGRGVGMDVVYSAIKDLNGNLFIHSEKGKGSEFEIHLPTNLTLIESILAQVEKQRYGIPLKDFAEIIDLNEYVVYENETGDMYFERFGEVITLCRVTQFLNVASAYRSDSSTKPRTAIINRSSSKPIAFIIDAIIGKQNLYVKPLERGLENLFGIFGTTIMPDGEAGLVLNLSEMVEGKKITSKGVVNG